MTFTLFPNDFVGQSEWRNNFEDKRNSRKEQRKPSRNTNT